MTILIPHSDLPMVLGAHASDSRSVCSGCVYTPVQLSPQQEADLRAQLKDATEKLSMKAQEVRVCIYMHMWCVMSSGSGGDVGVVYGTAQEVTWVGAHCVLLQSRPSCCGPVYNRWLAPSDNCLILQACHTLIKRTIHDHSMI